jgi:hypothetical protein
MRRLRQNVRHRPNIRLASLLFFLCEWRAAKFRDGRTRRVVRELSPCAPRRIGPQLGFFLLQLISNGFQLSQVSAASRACVLGVREETPPGPNMRSCGLRNSMTRFLHKRY